MRTVGRTFDPWNGEKKKKIVGPEKLESWAQQPVEWMVVNMDLNLMVSESRNFLGINLRTLCSEEQTDFFFFQIQKGNRTFSLKKKKILSQCDCAVILVLILFIRIRCRETFFSPVDLKEATEKNTTWVVVLLKTSRQNLPLIWNKLCSTFFFLFF